MAHYHSSVAYICMLFTVLRFLPVCQRYHIIIDCLYTVVIFKDFRDIADALADASYVCLSSFRRFSWHMSRQQPLILMPFSLFSCHIYSFHVINSGVCFHAAARVARRYTDYRCAAAYERFRHYARRQVRDGVFPPSAGAADFPPREIFFTFFFDGIWSIFMLFIFVSFLQPAFSF